jgi:hypothetical protein
MTIYHCLIKDESTTPAQYQLIHEASTEQEAMDFLEQRGGGIYRNILHNFDCLIFSKEKQNAILSRSRH